MLRILITIETNPHWEPLNNFDKVAAGIFRRQKAEQCSRGARQILDRPLVVATERINMNFHSLTRAHRSSYSQDSVPRCVHPLASDSPGPCWNPIWLGHPLVVVARYVQPQLEPLSGRSDCGLGQFCVVRR